MKITPLNKIWPRLQVETMTKKAIISESIVSQRKIVQKTSIDLKNLQINN